MIKFVFILIVFSVFSCLPEKKKFDIPEHIIFLPEEIVFSTNEEDYWNSFDSIVIMTKEYLIFIKGKFEISNYEMDTVLSSIPVRGCYGFEFRKVKNESNFSQYEIQVDQREFIKTNTFKFQWWDYYSSYYEKEKGSFIISGP